MKSCELHPENTGFVLQEHSVTVWSLIAKNCDKVRDGLMGRGRLLRILLRAFGVAVSLLILLSAVFANKSVWAQSLTFDVAAEGPEFYLGEYLWAWHDKEGNTTFDDILKKPLTDFYRIQKGPSPGLGYLSHPVWLRVKLANKSHQPIDRLFVIDRGAKQHLSLFVPNGDGLYTEKHSGNGDPAYGDLVSRHTAWRITVPPDSIETYYLRFDTRNTVALGLRLIEEKFFNQKEWVDQLAFGMFYGFLAAVGAYIGFVTLALRDRTYAYFAAFIISLLIYHSHFEAYPFVWWGELQRVANYISTCFGIFTSMFCILFCSSFLGAKESMPRLYIATYVFMGLWVFALPIFWWFWWITNSIAAVTALGAIAYMFVLSIRAQIIGVIHARLFVAAFMIFLLCVGAYLLRQLGVIPSSVITDYGQPIGSAISSLIFALALSARFRDIADRQEQSLRENEGRLELLVQERTSELSFETTKAEQAVVSLRQAQSDLIQAEKMASLGQLVAGVAHEINTPVGVALTAATHLEEQTQSIGKLFESGQIKKSDFAGYLEQAREASLLMHSNIDRASNLIQSFKQVAVDQTSDDRRRFDLKTTINEVVSALRPQLKKTSHKVVVQCPDDIHLDSYPGALGQVLTNFIMNSMVHGYEPGQGGTFRIEADDPVYGQVSIRYIDDGRGIPDDHINKIFDPFFTTKRNAGGTGLGLNIVYNLITRKLGGQVEVLSPPGHGAQFFLKIPLDAPGKQSIGVAA